MIVALLALTVALGGTAVAAVVINGKNIKNGTVTGKKLKNNTVTGKKVKESSLGRVPLANRANSATSATSATNAASAATAATAANADKLGGLAPGAFVQGTGKSVSGSVSTGTSTTNQTILEIAGIGRVQADCAANGLDATLEFVNASGGTLNVIGHSIDTPGNASIVSPNVPGLPNGNTTLIQDRTVGQSTVQAWNTNTGKSATIVVSNIFCLFNASATSNQ
jgi:hypothetical protein